MDNVFLGFAILATALLFICGIGLLVLIGWALGNAIASHHRARAHGYQADSDGAVFEDGIAALQNKSIRGTSEFVNPTDDDLREAIEAERGYSTEGNEGFEQQEPIPSGHFYNTGPG